MGGSELRIVEISLQRRLPGFTGPLLNVGHSRPVRYGRQSCSTYQDNNVLNPSDTSLIQACLAGDAQAWERLILRYERLIYSVAIRAGLSQPDADDVFQDVCMRLMENLEKLTDDAHIAGWLATTARWECLRMLRNKKRTSSFSELEVEEDNSVMSYLPSPDPLPLETLLLLERQQALRNAIEELGESCRRLLTLLYLTHPKPAYAEIAREFDIVESAVGPKRARCLHTLRKILSKQNFEEIFLQS